MTAENKLMILEAVEKSALPKRAALENMSIAPSTYYRWRSVYENEGMDDLEDKPSHSLRAWNRLTRPEHEAVVEQAILHPEEPPRQIAFMVTDGCGFSVSESTVYRILKTKGL